MPIRLIYFPDATGGVSGTLVVTETGDTASASGVVGHVGTLSVTEVGDSFSSSGAVAHTGTLSVAESADTVAFSGSVGHVGTSDVTEAGDVFEASGTVGTAAITGTIAVTEAPDVAEFSGTVAHTGILSVTESGDSIAASGIVGHLGTMAATEEGDAVYAVGTTGYAPVVTPSSGGGIGHSKKDKRIVVVEFDGNEYRVPIRKLDQFLDAIKREDQPRQKPKKLQQDPAPVEGSAVVVKSAPDDAMASIQQQIDYLNESIRRETERKHEAEVRRAEEDDEVILWMLAA